MMIGHGNTLIYRVLHFKFESKGHKVPIVSESEEDFLKMVADDFFNKVDKNIILGAWRSFKHNSKEKKISRQSIKIYLHPRSIQKFKKIQKSLSLSQGALVEKLIEGADSNLKVLNARQKIERFLEANRDSDDVRQLCNDLKETLNGVEQLGNGVSLNFLGEIYF